VLTYLIGGLALVVGAALYAAMKWGSDPEKAAPPWVRGLAALAAAILFFGAVGYWGWVLVSSFKR
jgi:hypothetical protein